MSLAWQDTPVFTQQPPVASPTLPPYTQSHTRPKAGGLGGGAPRSRKPLPFPLPDPYADTGQFELYDPRGLNLKRRESTSSSTGASAGKGGHERESSAGSSAAGGSAVLGVGLVMSPVEPSEAQEVLRDEVAPTPTSAVSEPARADTIESPATIPIPLETTSAANAEPPSSATSPPVSSPKAALSRLNSLRIGSSSQAQPARSSVSTSDPPPSSPDYFATPLPSVPHHSHARQPTSESAFSSHLNESRSRASSTTSISSALSPAASFLSSFGSGSRDASLSASGRFAALVDGDEEGFQVAGYVLGKELGRGGFGVVREATKVSSLRNGGAEQGEKVAVKIVRHRQPVATTPHAPVSTVGEALKRSVSGYRMPPHNRDRRMSLASEGQRIRSASTPVRRPEEEPETFPSVGTKATPAQIQALESTIAKLPGLVDANSPPSRSASPFASAAASRHQRDPSVDSVAEPPSLIQALLTREIHLWAQLSPHPHIVQLITTHQSEDFTYIFMPLCEGGNLLDFLNAGGVPAKKRRRTRGRGSSFGLIGGSLSLSSSISGPEELEEETRKGLPLSLAREIFGQIVEGLHYLHYDAGVTHRDIKLDNILCDEKDAGATGTWKIADFGLAESASSGNMLEVAKGAAAAAAGKSRSSSPTKPTKPKRPRGPTPLGSHHHGHIVPGPPLASLSRANSLSRPDSCSSSSNDLPAFDSIDEHLHPAGSLPYSTPEQMRSPIPILEPSGDVWAAGCVLYAMVQGVLPFTDEFEPRLRTKIMKGTWELPSNLLDATGQAKGEEEQRCLEVLQGCLEVDRKKRWTIKQVRESSWLRPAPPQPSPSVGRRGRELSRGRGPLPRHASASQGPSSRSGSEVSTGGSNGGVRRKERSTSRNSAAVKHLGVDERTRSAERKGAEREERKMRWERSRSRTAVRDASGSASATRTGSRTRNQRGVGAAGVTRGRADSNENRGRSRERGGPAVGDIRDAFDLQGVRDEAERLGRVMDTEPY